MFVEDFITELSHKTVKFKEWDEKFVNSIKTQIERDKGLSTKQIKTFQNIVGNYKKSLIAEGFSNHVIEEILLRPRYRNDPYQSINLPNEVRYLGDNKLGFRFKPTPELIALIKNTRKPVTSKIKPVFNRKLKIWVLSITPANFSSIMDLVSHFEYDDAVLEYLTLCENSKQEKSTFFIEGDEILANISNNIYLDCWVRNMLYGEIL